MGIACTPDAHFSQSCLGHYTRIGEEMFFAMPCGHSVYFNTTTNAWRFGCDSKAEKVFAALLEKNTCACLPLQKELTRYRKHAFTLCWTDEEGLFVGMIEEDLLARSFASFSPQEIRENDAVSSS